MVYGCVGSEEVYRVVIKFGVKVFVVGNDVKVREYVIVNLSSRGVFFVIIAYDFFLRKLIGLKE